MTLLEIIVKELPDRGGWPEHSQLCWQDDDGEIRFDSDVCNDFFAECLAVDFVRSGYHPITEGECGCISKGDYLSAIARIAKHAR